MADGELVCDGCGGVFPSVFELRRHQYGHDKGCMKGTGR